MIHLFVFTSSKMQNTRAAIELVVCIPTLTSFPSNICFCKRMIHFMCIVQENMVLITILYFNPVLTVISFSSPLKVEIRSHEANANEYSHLPIQLSAVCS